jgi:hypothetical protein
MVPHVNRDAERERIAAEQREAQLSRRVKELEEVVRVMRVENEKQVRVVLFPVIFLVV